MVEVDAELLEEAFHAVELEGDAEHSDRPDSRRDDPVRGGGEVQLRGRAPFAHVGDHRLARLFHPEHRLPDLVDVRAHRPDEAPAQRLDLEEEPLHVVVAADALELPEQRMEVLRAAHEGKSASLVEIVAPDRDLRVTRLVGDRVLHEGVGLLEAEAVSRVVEVAVGAGPPLRASARRAEPDADAAGVLFIRIRRSPGQVPRVGAEELDTLRERYAAAEEPAGLAPVGDLGLPRERYPLAEGSDRGSSDEVILESRYRPGEGIDRGPVRELGPVHVLPDAGDRHGTARSHHESEIHRERRSLARKARPVPRERRAEAQALRELRAEPERVVSGGEHPVVGVHEVESDVIRRRAERELREAIVPVGAVNERRRDVPRREAGRVHVESGRAVDVGDEPARRELAPERSARRRERVSRERIGRGGGRLRDRTFKADENRGRQREHKSLFQRGLLCGIGTIVYPPDVHNYGRYYINVANGGNCKEIKAIRPRRELFSLRIVFNIFAGPARSDQYETTQNK